MLSRVVVIIFLKFMVLNANGHLYLINPNGIYSDQMPVNVHALIASSPIMLIRRSSPEIFSMATLKQA